MNPGEGSAVLPAAGAPAQATLSGELGVAVESPTILIVDDEPHILAALKRTLRAGHYRVLTAESGEVALDTLVCGEVDLIISDMRMPGMSGADLFARSQALYPETMRILLTGYSEIEAVVKAINDGAVYRYLNKPWDDHDLLLTIRQALEQRRLSLETARLLELTRRQNDELATFNAELETKVRARTEEIRQTVMFLEDAQQNLKRSFVTMAQVGANMIELRCGVMGGESHRVGEMARLLALAMGFDGVFAQDLYFAGLLHGIGKLSLPDALLRKSIEQMTSEESHLFHQHPLRAQMVLTPMAELNHVAHLIRHQYERFNGWGTPDGLAGGDIPIGSRILAVARDYEELQSGGVIRQRVPSDKAAEIIRMQAGVRYDPQVVEHFHSILRDSTLLGGTMPYKLVASNDLCPGMRLADDVHTSRGVLLMTKGCVVSEHQVELVRRYEVQESTPFRILIQTPHSNPEGGDGSGQTQLH